MPENASTVAPECDTLHVEASANAAGDALPMPPVYPAVSDAHAALTRRIGRGRNFDLHLADEHVVLKLQCPAGGSVDWSGAITVEGPFGAITLAQGTRLIRALTGIDLESESEDDRIRWSWLQSAVLRRLAGSPFANAENISKRPRNDNATMLPLRLVLQSRAHVLTSHACANAATWLELLNSGTWKQEKMPARALPDFPVEAAIRIARHTMPASVLATLGTGNIIVPDTPLFTCDGEGRVHIGKHAMRVRFSPPSLLEVIALETNMHTENTIEDMDADVYEDEDAIRLEAPDEYDDMSDESVENEHAANETNPLLDDVPVKLDFDLGRLRMRISDLCAVGTGTVLTVEDGSPAAVTIRTSSKILGQGEIVDVNGKLGIRITSWGRS